jgi:hypothetical protein
MNTEYNPRSVWCVFGLTKWENRENKQQQKRELKIIEKESR